MCYYATTFFSCGDWTCGSVKERCTQQHRIGETCGERLIHHEGITKSEDDCKICQEIKLKQRQLQDERANIEGWIKEGNKSSTSIEIAQGKLAALGDQIRDLGTRRSSILAKMGTLTNDLRLIQNSCISQSRPQNWNSPTNAIESTFARGNPSYRNMLRLDNPMPSPTIRPSEEFTSAAQKTPLFRSFWSDPSEEYLHYLNFGQQFTPLEKSSHRRDSTMEWTEADSQAMDELEAQVSDLEDQKAGKLHRKKDSPACSAGLSDNGFTEKRLQLLSTDTNISDPWPESLLGLEACQWQINMHNTSGEKFQFQKVANAYQEKSDRSSVSDISFHEELEAAESSSTHSYPVAPQQNTWSSDSPYAPAESVSTNTRSSGLSKQSVFSAALDRQSESDFTSFDVSSNYSVLSGGLDIKRSGISRRLITSWSLAQGIKIEQSISLSSKFKEVPRSLFSCNHVSCTSRPKFRLLNVGSRYDMHAPFLEEVDEWYKIPEYLAFSHVWRTEDPRALTNTENLERRKKHISESMLPEQIRNSIATTRIFGFKYVWIESLCVVQDDREDWQFQLKHTGQIFRNAFATIVSPGEEVERRMFIQEFFFSSRIIEIPIPLGAKTEPPEMDLPGIVMQRWLDCRNDAWIPIDTSHFTDMLDFASGKSAMQWDQEIFRSRPTFIKDFSPRYLQDYCTLNYGHAPKSLINSLAPLSVEDDNITFLKPTVLLRKAIPSQIRDRKNQICGFYALRQCLALVEPMSTWTRYLTKVLEIMCTDYLRTPMSHVSSSFVGPDIVSKRQNQILHLERKGSIKAADVLMLFIFAISPHSRTGREGIKHGNSPKVFSRLNSLLKTNSHISSRYLGGMKMSSLDEFLVFINQARQLRTDFLIKQIPSSPQDKHNFTGGCRGGEGFNRSSGGRDTRFSSNQGSSKNPFAQGNMGDSGTGPMPETSEEHMRIPLEEQSFFRCPHAAANEMQSLKCYLVASPTVQRMKDYHLNFYHKWSKEQRKIWNRPSDTEEDRWYRIFLRLYPNWSNLRPSQPLPCPYIDEKSNRHRRPRYPENYLPDIANEDDISMMEDATSVSANINSADMQNPRQSPATCDASLPRGYTPPFFTPDFRVAASEYGTTPQLNDQNIWSDHALSLTNGCNSVNQMVPYRASNFVEYPTYWDLHHMSSEEDSTQELCAGDESGALLDTYCRTPYEVLNNSSPCGQPAMVSEQQRDRDGSLHWSEFLREDAIKTDDMSPLTTCPSSSATTAQLGRQNISSPLTCESTTWPTAISEGYVYDREITDEGKLCFCERTDNRLDDHFWCQTRDKCLCTHCNGWNFNCATGQLIYVEILKRAASTRALPCVFKESS